MNYSELVEVMHQFRAGNLTRPEMIAALALWQRPVVCTIGGEYRRRLAIAFRIPHQILWFGEEDPGNKYELALEGIIR